jgi:hypothetical protein
MTKPLPPPTRFLLVQSRSVIAAKRERIRDRLSAYLARSQSDPELASNPDLVATRLVDLLVDQVGVILETGVPAQLDRHAAEHRLHGISGRHYSRFGDALVTVIREALGPTYPRNTASAWGDAYWWITRQLLKADQAGSFWMTPAAAQAAA